MALGIEKPLYQNGSEFPPKADLRKMCSRHPIPLTSPGTIAPLSNEEATKITIEMLEKFNAALASGDREKLEQLFCPEQAYWRDQLALTYHLRTFTTPSIAASLIETTKLRKTDGLNVKGNATFLPISPVLQWIECRLSFTTQSPAASCSGLIMLMPCISNMNGHNSTSWKIWVLSTWLENLNIHPEDESLLRSPATFSPETTHTDVFIVGGGNSGVAVAARLKALGVDSIIAERNAHAGDNWALRYRCMKFHLPTASCELPYMLYPKELQHPHLLSRNELAAQVCRYVETFKLNYLTSAKITQTTQMPDGRWNIDFESPAGKHTIVARHLVQASGLGSQQPNLPEIADREAYKGISLHSAQYTDAKSVWEQGARSVLVIGSANTAFDILEDCHSTGLQTTMVARSSTYLLPLEHICASLAPYEHSIEAADIKFMTLPNCVDALLGRGFFSHLASQQSEGQRYTALAATGFPLTDSKHPDSLLHHHLYERGGGHLIDTGATRLIAEGKVSIKANVEPVAYTSTGLRFSDGSVVDSDAVVWCTGFSDKNVRETTTGILKTKQPLPVDTTWGVDEEAEIRGMWKRHSRVQNFWVMGGGTQHHRYYSRILALQIKAALEGILPPAYLETPQ